MRDAEKKSKDAVITVYNRQSYVIVSLVIRTLSLKKINTMYHIYIYII